VERRKNPDRRKQRSSAGEAIESLLEHPARSGLVGLAVAGTAAPIALSHYQNELRVNDTQETTATVKTPDSSEEGVQTAIRKMGARDQEDAKDRESIITKSLEKYTSFHLTRELAEQIYDAARLNRIDPEVAFGLVRAESSFKNTSTSEVGAVGLTQLMPRTAQFLEPGVSRAQLREPGTNLRIGFGYLRSLIDKYGGDENLALLAYNRGPGTVDKALKRGENPDNGYADFVRGKADHGHSLYTRR
jgi:membrane-bound lytic murein transglycosylase MltF